jgi:hypothetical protein
MKNPMDLCVHITQKEQLANLNEVMKIIPPPKDPDIYKILDDNAKVNQLSLIKLRDYYYNNFRKEYTTSIERIYFGTETCEYLIPGLEEVKEVYSNSIKEYEFTFVTPYVGERGIEKLISIFNFLNSQDNDEIEIVVNDFGVLQLLNTKFINLIPALGRLLIKFKRDPRFSVSGYCAKADNIKNINRVIRNQNEIIRDNSLSVKQYQEFLKKKGVKRIGIDAVPQGVNLSGGKKTWGFPVDLYWPWTYITSNRNCSIAAYTQLGKSFHPTEESCLKQCKLYEFAFSSDKEMFSSVQRGNAIWMSSVSIDKDYFKKGFDRLIFQPYIPI